MPNTARLALPISLLALLSVQVSFAAELPKRKSGQWQITTTTDDAKLPPRVEDVCLDDATSALLDRFALGASQKICSRFDVKAEGGSRTSVDAACKLGATEVTIHGETTFEGNTVYRETVKTHFDPPLRGRGESTSTREGKWTGPCAADMKPGDIVSHPSPAMPMAVRMNLNEMLKD
jgi:hypothetical protein